jgi:hypothetical protein
MYTTGHGQRSGNATWKIMLSCREPTDIDPFLMIRRQAFTSSKPHLDLSISVLIRDIKPNAKKKLLTALHQSKRALFKDRFY